ncbi:Periplasmic nitrate reductase [Labeo rohita]|uniref:Periplasmic nitrate reductase n=1 Tax=Labeo rohita TaxID=84645 RepID=A0ABQ8KZG2_LABRO|nr:Periplasmic nitrate reductase [Labeo rohita]
MFTATEQRLLLETYEEFKDVITKKGNTAAINKAREKATKKKTEVAGTGGGPPPASFTPAEELALEINKGRPVLEGIEGGTSSKMISRSIRMTKDSVCFMDPPDIILPGEGPSVEEDEETVSVCSKRPEDADTVLEPSQSGTTCDKNPENIKGVYKRYLLKQMEAIDIDIQYKKLKMRKLELEIQQLQKNASRFTLNKDKSH